MSEMNVHNRIMVRLLSALLIADRTIGTMRGHIAEHCPDEEGAYGVWPWPVFGAAQAWTNVFGDGIWLSENATWLVRPDWDDPSVPSFAAWVPCLEPQEGRPDIHVGNICAEASEFVVWGAYGAEDGFPVVYPVCAAHARRYGKAHRLDAPDEVVVFDPDLGGDDG